MKEVAVCGEVKIFFGSPMKIKAGEVRLGLPRNLPGRDAMEPLLRKERRGDLQESCFRRPVVLRRGGCRSFASTRADMTFHTSCLLRADAAPLPTSRESLPSLRATAARHTRALP